MQTINAIIVDDEENARVIMQNFLQEFCPKINIIAVVEDVKSAVKIINNNNINLVFLDVEMPEENGFALFDYFKNPKFETIFCTAYSQYAINAFEVSAVDYLLKPIGVSKLTTAVEKAYTKIIQNQQNNENISVLKVNMADKELKKIGLLVGNGLLFMDLQDIMYFEAEGSYTIIHHKGGQDMTVKKIKHFEDLLATDTRFFRIHRSYIVNMTAIKKYSKKDGLFVIFDNKQELPVSKEKKDDFEELLKINNIM